MNKVAAVKEPPAKEELKCKRCGQCCSQIVLPLSPLRLKRNYMLWKDWHDKTRRRVSKVKRRTVPHEIWLIYTMLIFIREANEFNGITQAGNIQGEKKYMYRCKHLVMENGKAVCTIHEIKPDMCSSYGTIPATYASKGYNSYYPNCVWMS